MSLLRMKGCSLCDHTNTMAIAETKAICFPPHKTVRQISKSFKPRVSLCVSPTNSISGTFRKLKKQGKVALIPFITAGDPDLSTTAEALKLLNSCGSDIIELGIPFSDPFLDGPVIKAACTRSLANGTNVKSVCSMLKKVASQISCPISIFTYYNKILEHGSIEFMTALNDAGVRGLVVPDIPLGETKSVSELAAKHAIEVIRLTTPTTPTEQMKAIVEDAQGFVYLVSSVGVTGVRASVNPKVESLVREIKQVTDKPVVVGFGISKPEHVQQIARWGADGVIVGSAIVKVLGEAESPAEGLKDLEAFAMSLKLALP
ncbi:hypothetical protein ACHQM5_005870 [Ranunculus cassubicifolius]